MIEVTRFEEQRQRSALLSLRQSPRFLESEEGQAFLDQLGMIFVPGVLRTARGLGVTPSWLEKEDIVNTAVVRLIENEGRAARYVASAQGEPWNYLARCLDSWVRAQWGTRCSALDDERFELRHPQVHESPLTSIEEVARLTHEALRPHTPSLLRDPLRGLLLWLAENPPQRLSYETADRAAAKCRFPAFRITQISAVANIAWGSRPRRSETSLMGAFLLDATFRPSDSPAHMRAILRYSRAMRAADDSRVSDEEAVFPLAA